MNGCLFVVLREKLALALYDAFPSRSCRVGDTIYRHIGPGQVSGFYDWLRSDAEEIVGVRYWPWTDDPKVRTRVHELRKCHHVVSGDNHELTVFFGSDNWFVEYYSNDQDFSFSTVYRADDETIALCFGLHSLSAEEIASLRNRNVEWLGSVDVPVPSCDE